MEYCHAPSLHHSIAPPLHRNPSPARWPGGLLIGAGLLALTMTGCGPSSDKTAKQSATNAAAPRVLAKTNRAPRLRPGVRTNLPPAAGASRCARTNCRARRRQGCATWRQGARPMPPAVARAGARHKRRPGRWREGRDCRNHTQSANQPRVLPGRRRRVRLPVSGRGAGRQAVEGKGREGRQSGATGDSGRGRGQAGQAKGGKSQPSIPATCSRSAPRHGSFGNSTPGAGGLC